MTNYESLTREQAIDLLKERDEQCRQLSEKMAFYQNKFFEDSRTSLRIARVEVSVVDLMSRVGHLETSNRVRSEMEGA